VWYWTEARKYARQNQRWNAWLYYEQAESLLLPAAFIASTNLDRLHNEQTAVMPAEVMDSLRPDHPWSITAANEEKYAFTAMAPEPGIPATTLDLGIHITATDVSDPAQVRERNRRAALALLAAVPEVRGLFHGVWVYAEASGHSPFALEFSMADLAAAASPSK
jgi:hypothetical protein